MTKYRIPKRDARVHTAYVRLHPTDARFAVAYEDDKDLRYAVRDLARAHAPRLLRTVPLTVYSVLRDGVPHGGPGLAHELMTEQLYRSARVDRVA